MPSLTACASLLSDNILAGWLKTNEYCPSLSNASIFIGDTYAGESRLIPASDFVFKGNLPEDACSIYIFEFRSSLLNECLRASILIEQGSFVGKVFLDLEIPCDPPVFSYSNSSSNFFRDYLCRRRTYDFLKISA